MGREVRVIRRSKMNSSEKNSSGVVQEDRYWELEKGRDELNKKVARIEQARRNLEALGKILGYMVDDDRLGNRDKIVDSVNLQIKIMGEVEKL